VDLADHVTDQAVLHAPVRQGDRTSVREDGTLVIDILIDPPCGLSTGREIVVCAPGQSEHRLHAPINRWAHQRFRPEIRLGRNGTVGLRAETDGASGADRVMVDLKIKF
jgi:hypothetical protein